MAIDAALTATFQNGPRAFMKNQLMAVRGLTINETAMVDGRSVPRPKFPAMANSPAPLIPGDTTGREDRNYGISQPIIMAGGVEKNTQYDGYTGGKTSKTLYSLRMQPKLGGITPPGMLDFYFLPYSDNMAYTMQLDSGPGKPRFFCTEAINGCTFQVAGTVDKPVVSHANVQGSTLTQHEKGQFLEFFLEPARVGAGRRNASVIAARLQRFSPSPTAVVNPASVVQYGADANAEFQNAALNVFGRSEGAQRFTRQEGGHTVTYEVQSVFQEMNGRPLDPTGGEVAVIGINPSGVRWLFFWSMYLPVKATSMYYRVEAAGARTFLDSIVLFDFIPLVSGRFLWPDWNAGTPYSVRNGHLGR